MCCLPKGVPWVPHCCPLTKQPTHAVNGHGADDLSVCRQMVREQAPDLYLSSLLLPDEVASDVQVLHAFHVEAVNITLATREPLAGEIRLQWWVEALTGLRNEEADGHPLARLLRDVIARHDLPLQPFEKKLNAHVFDLYREPMEDRTMFEAWCGEARSTQFQMSGWIAGQAPGSYLSDASGHAGVALGVVSVLQNLGRSRLANQSFIPLDLLRAAGLEPETFCSSWDDRHEMAIQAFIDLGREHLAKAEAALKEMQGPSKRVFLPLALAPVYFQELESATSRLHERPVSISQFRKQWRLWRASRSGCYS